MKVNAEIPPDVQRQIDRIIRDGWFPDQETLVREAVVQFVDAKTFLGDSPRMLHRFAADALNDSKPEVALKFVNRALSLSRRVPPDRVVILEGAVSTRPDVERAEAARADAVLVGEALMRSSDPARTTRRLRGGLSAIRG